MPGLLPCVRNIFDDARELRLLSDTRGYMPTSLESSTTSQLQLPLPEVCTPAQYLIDVGLRPSLARQLSSTYMGFVDRYRKICQSHFDHATHGGHLTEYYREVFVILFKRTVQAWDSRFVSIIRVQLCQASTPQAAIRPERVNIRVDNAAKAEIIARLGLKAAYFTSDKTVTSPNTDVTSRLEETSEQTHALSTDTVNSRLMSPMSPAISSTSKLGDPFSHVVPQTCFPAPYPPPPASRLPRNTLPTSFIPPTPPREVRSSANHSPDMSTLTTLFGRMTTTTSETDSRIPRSHGVFYIPDSNSIKPLSPILSSSTSIADNATNPQRASVEIIVSPTKPTSTPRRRKIASLPTRRSKISVSPSPPLFDPARISHPTISRSTEQVVEETTSDVSASLQKTHPVETPPSLYTAEAPCVATQKFSNLRQRKVHTLHKTLPQSQTIPQNQALKPLATAGGSFSYSVSRSPLLVSDTTSYFDSPPTSSDELDTPPSTPPRSHVLLAHASTKGLSISSESDGVVSHKGPLGDVKLPCPRQRYMHLDFTKGGWGRDEQPLTFTFGI
ncbi:hypothetical protein H4582DRAFT_855052 [Lactarius indigo]|nr:hypothetical protein H4582DRAFT_855052 [Lactarius indigo]